jgi:putative transposase
MDEAGRRHPARGVFISLSQATIVFVTVCTKDRRPWLDCAEAHELLVRAWKDADAWLVGRYVVMPDHVHFFCAPRDLEPSLETWMRFWKGRFRRLHGREDWRWQTGHWDTRLRRGESYSEKWEYVRENPTRAGLVAEAEAWPYQGELNELRW